MSELSWLQKLKRVFTRKKATAYGELEEDLPVTGIAGPKAGDKGYGRYVAEGVRQRWDQVAASGAYEKLQQDLGRVLGAFEALPDSRIGRSAAQPIKTFADQIPGLFGALNAAGQRMEVALTEKNPPSGADKRLQTLAEQVEEGFRNLDAKVVELSGAVERSVTIIRGHLTAEAKKNLGKNYANLHPETVMFFDMADKANKYASLAIGVIATAVGHPEGWRRDQGHSRRSPQRSARRHQAGPGFPRRAR